MSRSGYSDDCDDQWRFIMWRGAVASAIRGRRGQAFLRELIAALDALPEKKLISEELIEPATGEVCALGSVGKMRGIDLEKLDPHDYAQLAGAFGISEALVREIEFMNDEWTSSPEKRFNYVRSWAQSLIAEEKGS